MQHVWRAFFLCFFALSGALLFPSRLAAQASAEIRVTRSGGDQPLANANVELVKPGTAVAAHGVSDAEGLVRIPALDAGEYQITATAEGYFPVEYRVVVKPRQALALNVELAPREQLQQEVNVQASVGGLDVQQAGTARFLTRQAIEQMPAYITRDLPTLALNMMPGAVLSHDNFVHVRGNELSLHQFINGVSFLDNSHQHFTPGLSPAIFESANLVMGGFPAEFGNRFGGILDVTTRSGHSMAGHGSARAGVGTVLSNDASAEYGGASGPFGYYVFAGGNTSDRFLNPPVPDEMHDFGHGLQSAVQLDYQGQADVLKLLLMGGASTFQLPNTFEQQDAGRDTSRRLRSETAILSWEHVFSPRAVSSSAIYGRLVGDRVLPTSDPLTQIGDGSRSTLTTGVKTDFSYTMGMHTFKAGVDLARLRLLESLRFDPQQEESEVEPFAFQGGLHGGQVSGYAQDHWRPLPNLTLDLGLRWDQFDLLDTYAQISPRVGVAYHIPATHSVVHFAYNRFFSPPPIEYQLLAGYLGHNNPEEELRVGDPKPYRQHYFEAGWNQQLGSKLRLEATYYHHRGDDSFENTELGDTRIFIPTNFSHARARGAEVALNFNELERIGISGRFQYAYAHVRFVGPIAGGLADEALDVGELVPPAFDQTHTATGNLIYRNRWRGSWAAVTYRFGSGTPSEDERLPAHSTGDIAAGLTLWQHEPKELDFEFDLQNLSDNRYQIAKESELTPIQYAPRRVVSGRLKWKF